MGFYKYHTINSGTTELSRSTTLPQQNPYRVTHYLKSCNNLNLALIKMSLSTLLYALKHKINFNYFAS